MCSSQRARSHRTSSSHTHAASHCANHVPGTVPGSRRAGPHRVLDGTARCSSTTFQMHTKAASESRSSGGLVLEPTSMLRVSPASLDAGTRSRSEVYEAQVERAGAHIRNRSYYRGRASCRAAAFGYGLHGAGEPWTDPTRARARARLSFRRERVNGRD